MLGITRRSRKRDMWVRIVYDKDNDYSGKRRDWNIAWVGFVARIMDERWIKCKLEWYPREFERVKGRRKENG